MSGKQDTDSLGVAVTARRRVACVGGVEVHQIILADPNPSVQTEIRCIDGPGEAELHAIQWVHHAAAHPLLSSFQYHVDSLGRNVLRAEFPVVVTLRDIVTELRRSRVYVAPSIGTALAERLLDVAEKLHKVELEGRPCCMGRLSLENLLVSEFGELGLFVTQYNLGRSGDHRGPALIHQAPEVGYGAEPRPPADLIAVRELLRELAPLAGDSPVLAHALSRHDVGGEAAHAVHEFLAWVVLAPVPTRLGFGHARALWRNAWRSCRVDPDQEALNEFLHRTVAQLPRREIQYDPQGRWFQCGESPRVDLSRRPVLWRLFFELAESAHVDRELDLDELFVVGWPGEKCDLKARHNRVHVSLSELRRAGLRTLVERGRHGYRFARDVRAHSLHENRVAPTEGTDRAKQAVPN